MRREILTITCYRETFGDIDLADIAIAGTPFNNAKEVAKKHLMAYIEDRNIRMNEKPRGASLVSEEGRIVARFRVRPLPAGGHAIEEIIDAVSSDALETD
jgi:hypothetical protein